MQWDLGCPQVVALATKKWEQSFSLRVSGKSVATKFKKDSAFQINLEMYLKRTTSNYAAVNLGTLMGLVKMKVCLKTSAPKFLWAENKSDKLKKNWP